MSDTFYITTAIDYVNNLPHLGTAYEKIGADCFARFRRLRGEDVYFLMGTDEHSQKVAERAAELGVDPHTYCAETSAEFERIWAKFACSYDVFIRTTEQRHVDTVKDFLQRIHAKGDIYQDTYAGYYDVSSESFISEDEYAKLKEAGEAERASWVEEENYFFRLSAYADTLKAHFAEHPDFVVPEHWRNEVLAVLEGEEGLKDVCISRRSTDWGIPLPFDESTVTYVWFDALINYVSGAGYSDDKALYERFWPADVHVIGKDITRFHCLIWPAMLLAADLPLPRQVLVHGFVYFHGKKLSKSKGEQKVYASALDSVELFGPDALRYILLRHVSYGRDKNFGEEQVEGEQKRSGWEDIIDLYNTELANDYGNLVNRVRTLAAKEFDGALTRPEGDGEALDLELASTFADVRQRWETHLEGWAPHQALDAVWELVRLGNRYVQENKPWELAKPGGDRARLEAVLYRTAELVRWVALLAYPAIPTKAQEVWASLGLSDELSAARVADHAWCGVEAYAGIERGEALFPKVNKKEFDFHGGEVAKKDPKQDKKKGKKSKKKKGPAGPAAEISIDDFFRMDLRVAKVVECTKVEGKDRLLKLQVEVGGERRQLVSGIAEHYTPEELVGQLVVVVFNLAPAKLGGVESQGMILCADGEGGSVILVQPSKLVPSGAKVR